MHAAYAQLIPGGAHVQTRHCKQADLVVGMACGSLRYAVVNAVHAQLSRYAVVNAVHTQFLDHRFLLKAGCPLSVATQTSVDTDGLLILAATALAEARGSSLCQTAVLLQ